MPVEVADSPLKGNRDRSQIVLLVKTNRKSTLTEITNLFNESRVSQGCERTVRIKLFLEVYGRRVAKKKIRTRHVINGSVM